MKVAKGILLVIAFVAALLSVSPLVALDPSRPDPNPGGGSGGSEWTVTCQYDGGENLISKTCTSGGTKSCNCP